MHPFDLGVLVDRAMQRGKESNRPRDLLGRIYARCEVSGDCILWTGPTSGKGRGGGYGRLSFGGVTSSVHRIVFAIVFGPIPPRKQIDHTCNNRRCCNPAHLSLKTHKQNQKARDARAKAKRWEIE